MRWSPLSILFTGNSDCLPSQPKHKMEEPQAAVLPYSGSSMWCTDGCVGMTGFPCIHHQCKHLWFNKGRQISHSLQTGARLSGCREVNWTVSHSEAIQAKQLSVACSCIVLDDWGGNYWFLVNRMERPCPKLLSTVLVQQSEWDYQWLVTMRYMWQSTSVPDSRLVQFLIPNRSLRTDQFLNLQTILYE